MAMHQTILRRGQDPLRTLKRCEECCSSFHCTFCKTAFADFYKVRYHIENHTSIAVKHEDFVIVKCNLGCRETAHFHCCYCPTTILRRMAFIKHQGQCRKKLPPPSPSAPAAPLPPAAALAALSPPPPAQDAPSPPPPAQEALSSSSSSSSSGRLKVRPQVKLTCNYCGVTLNKKNLQVHINRKHRPTDFRHTASVTSVH